MVRLGVAAVSLVLESQAESRASDAMIAPIVRAFDVFTVVSRVGPLTAGLAEAYQGSPLARAHMPPYGPLDAHVARLSSVLPDFVSFSA